MCPYEHFCRLNTCSWNLGPLRNCFLDVYFLHKINGVHVTKYHLESSFVSNSFTWFIISCLIGTIQPNLVHLRFPKPQVKFTSCYQLWYHIVFFGWSSLPRFLWMTCVILLICLKSMISLWSALSVLLYFGPSIWSAICSSHHGDNAGGIFWRLSSNRYIDFQDEQAAGVRK